MTIEQLNMTAWLNRAFHAEKKVKALEYHKKRDKERAESITANCGGDVKGKSDSRNNSVEDAMLTLAESEENYIKALAEYNAMRREIQNAIDSLHNPELEAIFIYRYLEYMTYEKISEEMNCSVSTVKRKHLQGIKKLILNGLE